VGFTAPFIVALLAGPVLGERVGLGHWLAIAAGFCGALIVIRPTGGGANLYALLILGSAACYAVYQLLTRRVAGIDPPETSVTYSALMGTVVLSLLVPFFWRTPAGLLHWVLFVALGLFGGLGHYFVARGFLWGPASICRPCTLQLIWATAIGYLVFGHVPAFPWLGRPSSSPAASGSPGGRPGCNPHLPGEYRLDGQRNGAHPLTKPPSAPRVPRLDASTETGRTDYFWLRRRTIGGDRLSGGRERLRRGRAQADGALQAALYAEMWRIKEDDQSVPYRQGRHFLLPVEKGGSAHLLRRTERRSPREIILDLNAGHPSSPSASIQSATTTACSPTPSTTRARYTLFIKDLGTGRCGRPRREGVQRGVGGGSALVCYVVGSPSGFDSFAIA
jgi:hypothetical protein